MWWHTGAIAEAIQISKAKGAIFVVFIEGKDDQSKTIRNLIDNGELGRKLQSDHFVAIKIEANSVSHQQFSEIYKEPSVPSIYFIGKNGVALDIITGGDDFQFLPKRIENVLQKAGIPVASSAAAVSENLIKTEQTTSQDNVVCENGVCSIKSNSNGASTSSDTNDAEALTPEEKVERAKELLQKKREENEKQEEEKERQKEVERRKIGQNVQQLKKWQADQELKQLMEDREKEKRENQQARERVLAQIAQDKAERLSKSKPTTSETNKPHAVQGAARSNGNTTRLQFKLPNGSTSTQEFANSDTLQTVVTHIKANISLSFSNFRLSTTFPRREFTENDYSQSLLDLQLTPNAVILILPNTSGTLLTNQGGGFGTFIWTLLAPFIHVLGLLKNFIFGTNTNVEKKKPVPEPSTSSSKPENPRLRTRDTTVVKRYGNVHRLSDRRDSDDEGNTWNGNSTQQM